MPTISMSTPPRIGLIGVSGYGRTHLLGMAQLERTGDAMLAAYADLTESSAAAVEDALGRSVPGYLAYQQMLTGEDLDIVVISTPLHLHAEMIEQAFAHGASVLVEKPPVVTVRDHDRLLALQQQRGLHCQVGFQTARSPAVEALGAAVRSGALGELEAVGASAAWRRGDSYYARATWAGQLRQGERLVRDGTLTNPLAHALMNCLLIAGDDAGAPAVPETIEAELYRCRSIEGDDTSSMRIRTTRGHRITLATSLCAREQSSPYVFARGSRGTAIARYTDGVLTSDPPGLVPRGATIRARPDRSALLANLVQVVRGEEAHLLCPLAMTASYVRAIDGMYEAAGSPRAIPSAFLDEYESDGDRFVHLRGIEDAVTECAHSGRLFSEAGYGWGG